MEKKRNPNVLLSEIAYAAVRNAIANSELKPGDRVSEYDIAGRLNISRTPAREGLRKLENEGLLTAHPRRGLVVATVDTDAVYELYEARKILEGEAAAAAANRASESEIDTFIHLTEAEALLIDDPERMYAHNRVFHNLIYRAGRNRYLLKFLSSIQETLSAQRVTSTLVSAQRRNEVIEQHRALSAAIARRDANAARAIAVEHVDSALRARNAVRNAKLIADVKSDAPLIVS